MKRNGCARRVVLLAALAAAGQAAPGRAAPGTVSAEFLRVVMSPRAVGMGEAGTALSDDVMSSLSLNPAGLGFLSYTQGAFAYNRWLDGITLQQFAFAKPTEKWGTPALGVTMLRVAPIPGYDNSGAAAGDVRVQDMAVQLAYGRRVAGSDDDQRTGLFAGGGLKVVQEKLEAARAGATMADLGLLYVKPVGRGMVSAAYSGQSLGQGLKFDSERDPSPAVHRFGLAFGGPVLKDVATFAYDLRKPAEGGFTHGLGLELGLKNLMTWRMGFTSDADLGSGFRFGIGFHLKTASVDYALAHFGDFGFTHRVGLTVRFGEPLERLSVVTEDEENAAWHVERAGVMMDGRRYYEAALELNEALRLDPHNKEALRLMRQVREKLNRLEGYP
jgi:hypothetical protein